MKINPIIDTQFLNQMNETKRYLYIILNTISFIDNALPVSAIHISLHELYDFLDSEGETGTVMTFMDKVFPLIDSGIIEGSIPDMISQIDGMLNIHSKIWGE